MEGQINEQPIVEITKQLDYRAYRKHYYFRERRRPIAWVSWLALVLGPILWSIFYGADWIHKLQENIIDISAPTLFVFCIAAVIYVATAPRRFFRRNESRVTMTVFFENWISYTHTGQNRSDNGTIKYESVNKGYETKDTFYLQYDGNEWGIYPKKFFAPGQVEALRALFVRKFGERFKTKL